MGTPQFAVPSMLELYKNPQYEIVLVISEPNKPANRNMQIKKPEISKLAKKLNFEVFQPNSLKNSKTITKILSYKPDIIVTVAYGQFLPKKLLRKTINLHPSLLPKYRGPSPIQSTILAGDKYTGVSIMCSDEKIDHGPILIQETIKIHKKDNFETLSNKLAVLGAKLLNKTISRYLNGDVVPQKQNHQKATICKLINKSDGNLDFQKSASILERQIRAYFPWPSVYFRTKINNQEKLIKLLETKVQKQPNPKIRIGELYSQNKKDLYINCKKDCLQILKLQIEGKNPIKAFDFINGYLK